MLEDLSDSHARPTQWPLPPTIEQSEIVVRTHARFKAAWWDDPRLGVTIGTWPEASGVETWLKNLAETYGRFADLLGDRLSIERRAFFDRHALQDDYRLAVLWLSTRPIWHQSAGIPPVIWWNNLERIHLAVDDLGCRELLAA